MRPLRVSFVADTENWGGAETWLVHHLRRAPDHGVDPSVVCAEPVAERFRRWVRPDRLAVVPLARHADRAPATAAALGAQAPDVVHVNLVDPASNAATMAAGLEVAPTTATLHLPGEVGTGAAREALAGLYAGLAALSTPSAAAADQVRTLLHEPEGGVLVTGNGVDIPARPSGPKGHRPPRVGVVARLTRQKGIDVLLEAVTRLVADSVPVQVAVAGEGREQGALRSAAAGLPVTFVGWVAESRRFLADLDLFCLPSRVEALPLALLEAMADGLPSVVTDVGDVRRRVGHAVVLVPPEDPEALAAALAGLLGNTARRTDLGRLARACAEDRLDAADMVEVTCRLLHRAATSAAAR